MLHFSKWSPRASYIRVLLCVLNLQYAGHLPTSPHQGIWGSDPWIRMFYKLDRWFCCTLYSENRRSKAPCLGQTALGWRMRGTMGEQLWVGSSIICVRHRRLVAWWVLACAECWIQQGVGDYRTRIVLTRTLCSPSRLRKQDSQLSAFPCLTSLSFSTCSLTFLSTVSIRNMFWILAELSTASLCCVLSSPCFSTSRLGYGQGHRVSATTQHLRKSHFWNLVTTSLHTENIRDERHFRNHLG